MFARCALRFRFVFGLILFLALGILGVSDARGALPAPVPSQSEGLSSLLGPGEQLGFNPFLTWKTLETDHFRITHPEELRELAQLAGKYLEEANRLLSPVLQWTPRYRVQVVLIDNSDFANGLAAATGRFGMVLWSTPPDNWMSIAHYDDWFRMLCLHEYAHILNLDATADFWQLLRVLTGDGFLPNSLWPSWMLEGLAVTVETAFTSAGRGRSSYYAMLLRALEQGGQLADPRALGRIGGPRTEAPGGEVPYFFGNFLMTELAGKDLSRLGDLSLESSQGIPWMLNRYAERTSEKNWSEHWSSWVSRARARAQTDLKTIREAGLTEVAPLTQGNYSSLGVAFSADGRWLAYSREALDRRQGVYLRELASGREIRVSDQLGGASMAFTRDSSALVFSRVDRNGLYDFFSDLWLYDLAHEKLSRLSWGKRLRDPSLSQVDDRMVFTKNESGRTVLASGVLERTEAGEYHLREIQELFRPALLGRVSTPRLSPDGSKIVFSLHENGKVGESLYECRSECRQITSEGAYFDRFPFFDRDGRLYFVSNRSGVDNVYRWNSREHASALTNVSTAVWLPAFSPSGRLAASYYRDTGWDLAWVALNESARAPQVLPFGPEVVQASSGTSSSSSDTPIPSSWRLADYRVYPSILPRSWGPYFSYASGTGWSLGAVLLGFDALDFHRYMAQLEFHSGLSEADVDLRYSNRLLGVVWSLRGASQVASLYEATYSRRLLAETGLSLYYPRTFSAWNPALYFGYEKETEYAYPDRRSELGSGVLSTLIYSPVVKAELSYWGTQSSRQSIWPEEGMNVRLGNQWTLGGWLGSRDGVPLSVTQFLWTQSHFWHLGRHVVLSPNWQVSTSNRSSVRLEGRANTWLNSLPGSDFDGLGIRGYPLQGFFTKQAGVFALDLRFPIRRVERGWSTYPVFLRTIEAMSFIETSIKRPSQLAAWTPLPAWGLGLRSGLTLFYSVPVTASVQFHQGTRGSLGGKGEAFVDVQLGQLSF